jgi:hypothetical protein
VLKRQYSFVGVDYLLDPTEQERVIGIIREWACGPSQEYTEAMAVTIEEQISKPLWKWIPADPKSSKYIDVEAAIKLATEAEDISYGFRYRQAARPERGRRR